jgi:Ca2+-binding RTX toxin-like protein
MTFQDPLYWVNGTPVYPNQIQQVTQVINNTPDSIDVTGDLLINSLTFDEQLDLEIKSGLPPFEVTTSGTSYVSLTPDQSVTVTYNVDNFAITFDVAQPGAKLLLLVFSSGVVGGGLKIIANQLLSTGTGCILLKDDQDIIVDPTDVNGYNRASMFFVSDGLNWIELSRFLYTA